MTPPNGKFRVIGFAEDAASITVPEGTTHMTFAGSTNSSHAHVLVKQTPSDTGIELVVQTGLPIALNCTTLSNVISGGAFTAVSFLKIQP